MSAGSQLSVLEPDASAPAPDRAPKLRVCHIASGDLWAGAEVQVAVLLRHLARRDDLALSAIVLNQGRLADEIRSCNVPLLVIPEAENSFIEIVRKARRQLDGRDIHILHAHRYKEGVLASCLAASCRIPRVVRTQHGLPEPFSGWAGLRHGMVQRLDAMVLRMRTDRVISVTDDVSRHLARYVAPAKIVTILNGIDLDRVTSQLTPAQARLKLGIPPDAPVVGTAGRLERVKRPDLFVAVAARIVERWPGARFVIAGGGSEAERIRQLVRAAALEDRVLLLGTRDDVYDVLRAMDVFLLCSDHEGLPMVLLEAITLGVPVVARRIGGVPEVVEDNVSGLLVESHSPGDIAAACVRLLESEELRRRLTGSAAAVAAQRFNAAATAEKTARLYRELRPAP